MFRLQNLGLASLSFNQSDQIDFTGEITGAPRIFTYRSSVDTLAQIQDPSYFDGLDEKIISTGDVVIIKGIDGVGLLSFTATTINDFDTTNVLDITAADIADGSVTVPKLAADTLAYFLQVGNNLSDLSNAATARGNLGLGSAALLDVTDFLRPSQNLNDVANKATSFNTISPVTTKGDLIVGNGVNSNTRLGVGADTYVLTANSATGTGLEWLPGGGGPTGPADAIQIDVNQTAHGFVLENVLTTAGGLFVLAQANNLANSQVVGMVIDVIDVDNFTLLMDGYTNMLTGYVGDSTYYLSAVTPGFLTATEPVTPGQISRPLLRALSATTGIFFLGKSTFTTATWLQTANDLSDLSSPSTARSNLGLGTAAVQNVGFFLQSANNLSDLTNAGTARTNLGLGTLAVINSPVPVANGGTGQTSAGIAAANAIGALAIANNLSDVGNATTSLNNLGGAFATTTMTVNGTANEITSSAGAQSLAANRTWTLSLPAALTFTGKTITGGSYASATATLFTFTTGTIGTAVTGVTQAPLTSNTTIATTQYVDLAVSGGTGANTALSNLASVAINTALISDGDTVDDLGSATLRWRDVYAESYRTAQSAGNTFSLSAWDVDGAVYVPFISFFANNTPSCALQGVFINNTSTGVTQTPLTSNTTIATTEYVDLAVTAGGGGGAPTNATYIVQTASAGLSNEQALGALATGILKSTTTTGIVSIAVASTDYADPATTITINGTANEITSSAGSQSLAANRTWTLSLPSALTFTGKTITGGDYASASATLFTFTTGTIGTAVTGVTQTPLTSNTTMATTAYVDLAVSAGGGSVNLGLTSIVANGFFSS